MAIDQSNNASNNLNDLGLGAILILAGSSLVYLFRLLYKLLLSRYLGPQGFGIFSLGEMVLEIAVIISLLGLPSGIKKFISHYRSLGRSDIIKGVILGSLRVSMPLSIILTALILLGSNFIALQIFHEPGLTLPLMIFALIIPFNTLVHIFSNIFVGFKAPKYLLISVTFGRNFLALIFGSIVLVLGGGISFLVISSLISFIISGIISILILQKRILPLLKSNLKPEYNYKELMIFSVPLFLSVMFTVIMGWTDTFFLGSIKTSTDVGIYNAALSLSMSLGIFYTAFGRMAFPVMCGLFASRELIQISKIYSTAARWIYACTVPVFLIMLFFSSRILTILFGTAYIGGSTAFIILLFASFFNSIIGPSAELIMTFKKTRFLFYVNIFVTLLNIILNFILVPRYGLIGAAIATAVSITIREMVLISKVRKLISLKYSFWNYIKYSLSALLSIMVIYIFVITIPIFNSLIGLIFSLIIFLFLYLILIIISKSYTSDDIKGLEELFRRMNKLNPAIEQILNKLR